MLKTVCTLLQAEWPDKFGLYLGKLNSGTTALYRLLLPWTWKSPPWGFC